VSLGPRAQRALFALLVVFGLGLESLYVVHLARWPSAPDRGFIVNVRFGVQYRF